MPELPEVETTRRGIATQVTGRTVAAVVVREPRLRWPVPADLGRLLTGRTVVRVGRRAKYLLLEFPHGVLIVHLGMSGSLRVLPASSPASKHDHLDLVFGEHCLRLRDPRRFGAVLWSGAPVEQHPRLAGLGPEPLADDFDGAYLARVGRARRIAVKTLIMDGRVVVGVGNIYANEALFRAGIHPARRSDRIGPARYERLAAQIKTVLQEAIAQGGTTLRDFLREDGQPGYFRIRLQVYGRGGEPCPACGKALREARLNQRSTVYCNRCQR
jgi:formamidopyrimidine-DNA glycosylase